MRKAKLLIVAMFALALLAVPASAPAKSRYKVGISEQSAASFTQPLFTALKMKRVHYIMPWDWNTAAGVRPEVESYMAVARAQGLEPFVTFTAHRGCWSGTKYSKSKACKAPSTSKYTKAFKAFRKAFPTVKVFSAWNEVNHKSQPTYKSPKLAARYYNAMKKACKKCKVVAADLLDSSNLTRYLKSFKRYAKGKPKLWGLHNYSDVNRKRDTITKKMLRAAGGEVWLTETGGLVNFTKKFPYSTSRAANRISYMFKLADKYSKKRRGYKSKITRIYPYQYSGVAKTERFDAGLINPDGTARKGYTVFKSKAKTRSK